MTKELAIAIGGVRGVGGGGGTVAVVGIVRGLVNGVMAMIGGVEMNTIRSGAGGRVVRSAVGVTVLIEMMMMMAGAVGVNDRDVKAVVEITAIAVVRTAADERGTAVVEIKVVVVNMRVEIATVEERKGMRGGVEKRGSEGGAVAERGMREIGSAAGVGVERGRAREVSAEKDAGGDHAHVDSLGVSFSRGHVYGN